MSLKPVSKVDYCIINRFLSWKFHLPLISTLHINQPVYFYIFFSNEPLVFCKKNATTRHIFVALTIKKLKHKSPSMSFLLLLLSLIRSLHVQFGLHRSSLFLTQNNNNNNIQQT